MDLGWVLVVPAYLLGTFPTAILVGRRLGSDPTAEGSGNPGASNTMRNLGRRAGAVVLVGDLGKGVVASLLGLATGHRAVGVACGLAAVVGHVFPVTRRFRGGKGVATAAGMVVVLAPVASLGLLVLWALVAWWGGVASLASLATVVAAPGAAAAVGRPLGEVLAFAAGAALVVFRHRENIGRLRRGEERSLRRRGG